jgi:spore coat protein U-like protein
MSSLRSVATALILLCLPGFALAVATCNISTTGPAFGTYDPSSATATTANGSVTATCTWISGGNTTVNLVVIYGPGNAGTYPNRFMLSGAQQLNYNIYFESSFTTIRGNGTAGTQTGQATLSVSSGNPTVTATGTLFGRIPAGQNAAPGSYSDTIVVTMNY